MWKNVVQPERPTDKNLVRRMRFAYWITKATETHSEYAILPRQILFRKSISMLVYVIRALPVLFYVGCYFPACLCNV